MDLISEFLSTTESLSSSRDDDAYVRIALYPETYEWLLRYNIDSMDGEWCDFDFSADLDSPAAALIEKISANWPGHTDISESKFFFDNSYGG